VLAYFYKRALEDATSISELNFRYPGPRPRSKESAVLLLADAVESASRTLAEPTQGSIRALIDRMVEQRLQDDQLSQSPLNLHDLEVITATFERMLTAILHRRITYPSAEEFVSVDTAERQARAQGHDVFLEVAVLCVHGLTHLLGFDHRDEREWEPFRQAERRARELVHARADRPGQAATSSSEAA
jgi:rRNA maturation RNase YbeY